MRKTKSRKGKRGAFVTIVFYVACLTFLVVALCAGVYYSGMNRYLKKQIETGDDANLRQLSSSYELFLKNTIDSSMVFIENDAKNVMSLYDKSEEEYKRQMYRHLESISQMTGFIDSVYFYDKNTGMVYLSTGISYERNDFYDGPWLETLKEGRNAWEILSARQMGAPPENEKNIVPIVIRYPFSALNGSYLYVINLRADQLFQYLLKSICNYGNKNFKVINDSRNIFISSDSRENFKNIDDFPYLARNRELMQGQPSGSFIAGEGGERKVIHYTSSSQYNWLYVSEMDYELILRQLREPLILILLLTAFLLVLSLLLCLLFSKRLYKPVKSLIEYVMSGRAQEQEGGGEKCENKFSHSLFVRAHSKQVCTRRTDGSKNEYEVLKEHFRHTYSENQTLQDAVQQNRSLVKKQFMYNLLAKNYYTEEEIAGRLTEMGIQPEAVFVAALFSVDEWKAYLDSFDREVQSLWEYAFENIACEISEGYGKAVFVGVDANRFALVYAFEDTESINEAEGIVKEACGRIVKELEAFIRFSFSAGIGLASQNAYTMNKSYEQAREALASLADSRGQVVSFREMHGEHTKLNYPFEKEIRLMEIVKNGDGARAAAFLTEMYEEFRTCNGSRREGLSYFTFLLLTAMMKQGNELGFTQEEMFDGYDMTRLWEMSVARKDEKEMLSELTDIVEGLCGKVNALREGVSNSQVLQITQFIRENYRLPITLGDIAEHAGVNQSTVSRLMTQNLKMSTVDYINQVRIEKAIQLIGEGRRKVADLSEEAGFNNTHYFIRVFKKITGKTPGNMIEELSDKKEDS